MSSTNKTANYQLSQFVGTDIPSILNDYNGDMRKIDSAIKETSVAGGDNATAIAELQATTGRLSTEVGGINSTVNSVSGRVLGIEDKIPANASSENKLITAEDIPEIPSVEQIEQNVANLQTNVGELQEEVSDMGGDVKAIQLCVPNTASESNKFATMADINSGSNAKIDKLWFERQTFLPFTANITDVESLKRAISDLFIDFNAYIQMFDTGDGTLLPGGGDSGINVDNRDFLTVIELMLQKVVFTGQNMCYKVGANPSSSSHSVTFVCERFMGLMDEGYMLSRRESFTVIPSGTSIYDDLTFEITTHRLDIIQNNDHTITSQVGSDINLNITNVCLSI